MIERKCKHKWRQFKNARSESSALYECAKCKVWLTASDVYQLESLIYMRGFQKWLSVVAIVISVGALFISILK
jgi:hypothetical protein